MGFQIMSANVKQIEWIYIYIYTLILGFMSVISYLRNFLSRGLSLNFMSNLYVQYIYAITNLQET